MHSLPNLRWFFHCSLNLCVFQAFHGKISANKGKSLMYFDFSFEQSKCYGIAKQFLEFEQMVH